jgi:hypothetical protein
MMGMDLQTLARWIFIAAPALASCGGDEGDTSVNTDAGTVVDADIASADATPLPNAKTVSLSFTRVPNELGLDPFVVTATLSVDDVPQDGQSPLVTVGRGTHSAAADEGDGTYTFEVTPAQTGEHSVTVCFDAVCETRTALVIKEVHPDWGQPMSVSGLVNTEGYEDGITITPDGRYLLTQTGPNYGSGSFVFDAPRASGGCGGNRLEPTRCTHPWINEVVGPYSAPERPGFHDGRIAADGTLLHNANSWSMDPEVVNLFSQSTMFYGFKRQSDGTFAEPFFISFDDENDALAGPFGMSFVMTGQDTATMIFSHRDETGQVLVDTNNNGSFDTPSGFDLQTLEVTLGQNNSLGELVATGVPGTPPVRGPFWPTNPVNLSATGTDGIFGSQGNGHLFEQGGSIHSIWTDDEYDADSDAGEISVYVLTSGTFPNGEFEKTILPSKINTPGIENREIMPFFTGTSLYFAVDNEERLPEVWFASYSGPQTSAGYADNANWGDPERVLQYDENDSNTGSVFAMGEPTLATFEGTETMYFGYVLNRGVDPLTNFPDINFQAGFVPKR